MKPLMTESRDNHSLQTLGRASVQIVHDLKNQINGLKLYATFLRKRSERSERPEDEIETINKLIAGLDRTAHDLSVIVEYGQPVELKKQPGVDLNKLLHDLAISLNEGPRVSGALNGPVIFESGVEIAVGEFDPARLGDALKSISTGALKLLGARGGSQSLKIALTQSGGVATEATIEWKGFESFDHDPFRSFKGSDEVKMAVAARVVEAHGGRAERQHGSLQVHLPLSTRA